MKRFFLIAFIILLVAIAGNRLAQEGGDAFQKIKSLGQQVNSIFTQVKPLRQQVDSLSTRLESLEQGLEGVSAKMDSISSQMIAQRKLYDMSVIGKSTGEGCKPNVILIISDALRADHISAINPKTEYRTTNIDRLAGMGALFTNAIAQAPHTFPAMGSIFTGLYPSEHKGYAGLLPRHRWDQSSQVAEGVTSFLDRLRANGYGTYTITQNYSPSQVGIPITKVDPVPPPGYGREEPKAVIDSAIEFVRLATAPYFLYLHILDPHDPYDNALDIDPTLPPREYDASGLCAYATTDVAVEHKKYKLEIQGVDRELGRLMECLMARDYFKDNVLIFLADHGEYFNERPELHSAYSPIDKLFPMPHGFDLHQEQIHVPLVIVTPATFEKGVVVKKFVETRALFSTIIELTGSGHVDERVYPRSLVPLMSGGGEGGYCISEGIYGVPAALGVTVEPFDIEHKSIISPEGLKLIYNTLFKTITLYDLNNDPEEQKPLDLSEREQQMLELKRILAERIDIDADFIKPVPHEAVLSMPRNSFLAGVKASSVTENKFLPYALDGDPETFWKSDFDPHLPVSLTLVLKNPARVEGFKIEPRADNPQWFKKAHLLASDNGYRWNEIADIVLTDYAEEEKLWKVLADKDYKYYKLDILELPETQHRISIAELCLMVREGNK